MSSLFQAHSGTESYALLCVESGVMSHLFLLPVILALRFLFGLFLLKVSAEFCLHLVNRYL